MPQTFSSSSSTSSSTHHPETETDGLAADAVGYEDYLSDQRQRKEQNAATTALNKQLSAFKAEPDLSGLVDGVTPHTCSSSSGALLAVGTSAANAGRGASGRQRAQRCSCALHSSAYRSRAAPWNRHLYSCDTSYAEQKFW